MYGVTAALLYPLRIEEFLNDVNSLIQSFDFLKQ